MRIRINTADIHQVLKVSSAEKISVIAHNNTVHIISDIKEVKNGISEDKVICRAHSPWIEKEGEISINRDVLMALSENHELLIDENSLECGNRKISFITNAAIDNNIINLSEVSTISKVKFDKLIEVEYAACKTDERPILMGIYFYQNEAAALDGFRVAIRTEDVDIPGILIPVKLIKLYKKIKSKVSDITILETVNEVGLRIDNLIIITKKIPGDYIKYKDLIPKEFDRSVELDNKKFLSLLKSYKKVDYVKLNFSKDRLTIIASNETLTIEDQLECKFTGDEIEIAFNIKYLMETLKQYKNPIIRFNSNVQPLVITEEGKKDLILPVRLKK